jgi:hypothetical protein
MLRLQPGDTVDTEQRWDTPALRRGAVPFCSSTTDKGHQLWLRRHCWYGSRPSPAKKTQSRNFFYRHCRSSNRNPARNRGSRFGSARRRSALSTPSLKRQHARRILAGRLERLSRDVTRPNGTVATSWCPKAAGSPKAFKNECASSTTSVRLPTFGAQVACQNGDCGAVDGLFAARFRHLYLGLLGGLHLWDLNSQHAACKRSLDVIGPEVTRQGHAILEISDAASATPQQTVALPGQAFFERWQRACAGAARVLV